MTVRAMIGKGLSSAGGLTLFKLCSSDCMHAPHAEVGYEFQFPMHSPLITRIQVMRRGFIGRNKNACAQGNEAIAWGGHCVEASGESFVHNHSTCRYFLRGMVGKRNIIPIDKARQRHIQKNNSADSKFTCFLVATAESSCFC